MTDMTNWREDAVVAFTIAKASGRSRPNVEDADLTDSILKALEDSNHIIMNRVEQISIVAMFKEVTSKRADFFSRLAVLCGHDWYDIHIRGGVYDEMILKIISWRDGAARAKEKFAVSEGYMKWLRRQGLTPSWLPQPVAKFEGEE